MTLHAPETERRTPRSAAAPDPASDAREAQIVVVDDEPLNAQALLEFLGQTGQHRALALNAVECTTQRLRDEQPDLVLLELALADGDAFELLRALQDDRLLRHVPVIVLSDRDDRPTLLRALQCGAVDFLVKPVDGAELKLRLHNTLAAKAYRDQLAHVDHVTGLPNRDALLTRLDWALKHTQRHAAVGAVLHIGLDRFRQVNDALGPSVGDELLHAVAQRLVSGLRDTDLVSHGTSARAPTMLARGSGDEFTVLLPLVERAEDAAVVASRMIERMTAPFTVAGHELFVSCRVGIAIFPGDSAEKDTILRQATVAMHHAGRAGQPGTSSFQFYSAGLNQQSMTRLQVERELHHALERGELRLHYQAQVDVAGGTLRGAEALLRWQHPQRGLLGPAAFIGVAEETGQIVRMGQWVLREAVRQLAQWRARGLALAQISVNVSSLQLQRTGLFEEVRDALAEVGLPGETLCLELTESAIIDSGPQVAAMLESIKGLGVELALDDFGTGYSSLTHLRRFPIDELKIDRSFVCDCESDPSIGAITGAIIAMARHLGLRVVAEGVETAPQLAFLARSGADACQGYLFAKPVPAGDFVALLAQGRLGPRAEPLRLAAVAAG